MGVVMAAAAVATEKEEVEMELVVVMAGSAGVGELTGQEAAVTAMVEEAAVVGMNSSTQGADWVPIANSAPPQIGL